MRLIDADALIDELGISDEDIIFEGMLVDAPTIDVAPVRHGRWEKNDDYTCSLCGYRMVIGDGAYNYCPNCGARMDGEK